MGALGILSMLAGVLQVNVFSQAVVTILGLGLAIDYGLFMVSRFREELDRGRSVEDAVALTTQHAGRTVVFSALMVVVALSGLLMMPQAFPEFRTEPIKLVVTNADNRQLVDVIMQTRAIEGLTAPMAPSTQTVEGTTVLSAGIADREDNAWVMEQLRAIEAPPGVGLYIGGTPAMEIESIEALLERLPWLMLYMVVATFLLMALLFGSLVLPAKAVIMNFLGIGATVGLLTLMFVDGLGSGPLNFTPGPLMSPVLVLIVVILYGLSTDYEVFLVSRMVEARDKGASTDEAVTYGTARTGSIITAAALIMIVVAAAFAFSDIVMMKYIAFGMIFSLAIDATIIRLLLVPAVMHLLREDNWWAPRAVKAAYHRIGGHSPGEEDEDVRVPAHSDRAPSRAHAAPAAAPASESSAGTGPATRTGTGTVAVLERAGEREDPATTSEQVYGLATADDPAAREEIPVEEATVVEEDTAARGGISAGEDTELVPFAELMARLRQQGYGSDTERENGELETDGGRRHLRGPGQE